MKLRKLSLSDELSFTKYLSEQVLSSGAIKGVRIEDGYEYKAFLDKLTEYENVPFISYEQPNYPSYQFVLEVEGSLVGAVVIRPYLTKTLFEEFEGNIGYSVSPSERGKGYANLILTLAIEKFKELNSKCKEIVLCCYKENIPSRKVIKKHGGILVEELKGIVTPQKYVIKI